MPLDAAATCWTITEDKLATLLSQSARFQTWLGVGNAALALAKVFFEAHDPDDSSTKFAIVGSATNRGFGKQRINTPWAYRPFGNLVVSFEWLISPAILYAEINRTLKNHVGIILDEVLANNANTEGIGFERYTCYGPYHQRENSSVGTLADPGSDIVRIEVSLEYREP